MRADTYGQQPTIGQWNLAQLAQALLHAELVELVCPSVLCPTLSVKLAAVVAL